jgi:putative membrane protein
MTMLADLTGFQPHPEVWLLVGGVVVLGFYVARVIGPKVVADGERPVSGRQVFWFGLGVVLLWVASDYPMHDVAEGDAYTVHMVQHLVLTFLVPPCFWLATPEWLARLVIRDDRRSYVLLKRFGSPVVAGVLFNAVTVLTHWPPIVNTSVAVAPFHYTVHVVVVTTAFLMWIPVCGPWPELRLSVPGQMIYLFLMSVVPTVPGAWLSLAGEPLYSAYDHGSLLWGMSTVEDQATAGVFMKLGGGAFLWAVIIVLFFRWAAHQERESKKNRLVVDPVTMQPVGMGISDDPPRRS